jgi:membrane associated rhomboid family serine protease
MVPIPLRDHIRRRTFWAFTLLLIVANTWVFLIELSLGRELNRLVYLYGLVPAHYTVPGALLKTSLHSKILPVFTSMFLHGGWLHLIGNMLFLFVFGRSIEDRFGHGRFLLMYFAAGVGAAFVQVITNAGSHVPTIGASGAIAGILAAYFICYPSARITTLIPLFFFWTIELPAILLLGYWFLIQFVAGYQMLAIETATSGGVAWWAHVGGFVVGAFLALLLKPRQREPLYQVFP